MAAQTFPSLYAGESRVLTFDFTADLAVGETLTGAIAMSVQCYGLDGNLGRDPVPSAILSGAAAFDATSKKVLQTVAPTRAGVSYLITAEAATTTSGKRLDCKGILPVVSV